MMHSIYCPRSIFLDWNMNSNLIYMTLLSTQQWIKPSYIKVENHKDGSNIEKKQLAFPWNKVEVEARHKQEQCVVN